MRASGILLPISSLPSPYGIGSLGKSAYQFVDFLKASKQKYWQVLPIVNTSFGESPYQSVSTFAGGINYIDLDLLVEDKYLNSEDVEGLKEEVTSVDYGKLFNNRYAILKVAFLKFKQNLPNNYFSFIAENNYWLDDFALFMSLKKHFNEAPFNEWPKEFKLKEEKIIKKFIELHSEELDFWKFTQYIFFEQWYKLKLYANASDVRIIGDLPIYVAYDSSDVWSNPNLFELDENMNPYKVAGVPPDYFSATGQLWGNPLYDWKAHKKEKYRWWVSRIRNLLKIADYVRIDHFRGLEQYWSVPYGEETAMNGKWEDGPKADLFLAIEKELGKGLPIIAEDLGVITPEVEALRDRFGLPGMRVLQFGFDSGDESTFLPHQFDTTNCVCYTGTHDNNTTRGWYANASEYSRDKVRYYMNTDGYNIHWDFIRTCMGTIATYAIFPMQDVLGIGEEGRMNTPGVGTDNWSWRYKKNALSGELAKALCNLTRIYGR